MTRWPGDDCDARRMVCKRCHHVMEDGEPMTKGGEFFHKRTFADGKPNTCVNAGKTFYIGDDTEVEPFMRKSERRVAKRGSKRR